MIYNRLDMTARAETVTILFTDLVESTELLQRAGDERAQRIFKAHHRLLSNAVQLHGGHEVKWLGDGLMVAFPSAYGAIQCAIAMQQAARRPAGGERLQIRVGLNVGDALLDETDYFGAQVVLARRLCDRASAGQIFASDTVRRLVSGRQEIAFNSLGELELKGFGEPTDAVEVLYEHDPLSLLTHTPFIGRKQEAGLLIERLRDLRSGRGGVVMVAGEPGIGKTRLVTEFAEAAKDAGATVLWGRCYEGEWAPPFAPFVEVIREHTSSAEHAGVASTPVDATVVDRLAPLLGHELVSPPDGQTLQPDQERFLLLDAVSDYFESVAMQAPLVCVLDDLHWADRGSIAMLQHAARRLSQHAVLFVGAYRDVEVGREHPLSSAMASLRREKAFELITLAGLDSAEVGEMLDMIAEQDVPESFAHAIKAETEGNPLFIREVLIHLIEERRAQRDDGHWADDIALDDIGVPEGIREVIGRRLLRLSVSCERMLSVASAMSGGFSWSVLRAISGEEESVMLDALDEALGAQLLAEQRGTGEAQYDFTHALVRQTLYEGLSSPRRAALHRRIGEALESLHGANPEMHLGQLAYHFSRASAGGEIKAIEYARRAGDHALSVYAYDEAIREYERALDAVELDRDFGERRRCLVLISLGEARLCTGSIAEAKQSFWQAIGIARQLADTELFARAALGYGREWESGTIPHDAIVVLEQALSMLGEKRSALRSRLLAGLANTLYFAPEHERKDELTSEAIAIARETGDTGALAFALYSRHFVLAAVVAMEDRLAAATETVELAEQLGDTSMSLRGHAWRVADLIEMGDVERAWAEAEAVLPMVRRVHLPFYLLGADIIASMRTLFEGRFADCEPMIARVLATGQSQTGNIGMQVYGAQMFALRWMQGRLAEVESLFKTLVDQSPNIPTFRVALAFLYSELGRDDDARRELDTLAAGGFSDLPRDTGWLPGLTLLGQVAARLCDRDRSQRLYDLLLPYADRNVVVALAAASSGSCERYLGILAASLQRWPEAERHFQLAVVANERMRTRPFVALTQFDYAQMLTARNGEGDAVAALDLLREAQAAAQEMGMTKLNSDCERLLATASP
jgi:class 3 adenylate cyclase/tetratricopeptide (TPR) repeat protein